jgi:hypothetical protein
MFVPFFLAHVIDISMVIILVKADKLKKDIKKMFWLTCAIVLYNIIEP